MLVLVVVDFKHSVVLQENLGAAVIRCSVSAPVNVAVALAVTVPVALIHQVESTTAAFRSGNQREGRRRCPIAFRIR